MKPALALASLLFATACGPKAATTTKEPVDNVGTPSGPPYAALFEAGASWNFKVSTLDSMADDNGDPQTETGESQATCTVERVDPFDGGKVATVTCDFPENTGMDPLSGTWASNDQGLWRLYDPPVDGAAPELATPGATASGRRWATSRGRRSASVPMAPPRANSAGPAAASTKPSS